uniref:Uncharacterized protein n=1 Tax=Timema cristinae TaxID=61476 RepID=A0A7R9GQ64_TIMCR|nr:unnamed protein product [Timema cristinae]
MADMDEKEASSPINYDEKDDEEPSDEEEEDYRPMPKNRGRGGTFRALSSDDCEPPKKVEDILLTTQYHHGLQHINTILNSGYKFLTSFTQTQNLLSSPPRVTFKWLPNLHNILVHPKLPDPKRI